MHLSRSDSSVIVPLRTLSVLLYLMFLGMAIVYSWWFYSTWDSERMINEYTFKNGLFNAALLCFLWLMAVVNWRSPVRAVGDELILTDTWERARLSRLEIVAVTGDDETGLRIWTKDAMYCFSSFWNVGDRPLGEFVAVQLGLRTSCGKNAERIRQWSVGQQLSAPMTESHYHREANDWRAEHEGNIIRESEGESEDKWWPRPVAVVSSIFAVVSFLVIIFVFPSVFSS